MRYEHIIDDISHYHDGEEFLERNFSKSVVNNILHKFWVTVNPKGYQELDSYDEDVLASLIEEETEFCLVETSDGVNRWVVTKNGRPVATIFKLIG